MSNESDPDGDNAQMAVARVERKRGFSLIWLIPIVAAVAGAWLVYVTLSQRGPTISITFQTASGIEPGKTPIRYRDVQLGTVDQVTLTDDLQKVVVTARMSKEVERQLRTGTQFWIESARITAAGVSGLGTLLSGSYIVMRPGEGEPERHFTGLDVPPVYQVDMPGRQFVLHADTLGSVASGAPIYFRGIQVGGILGHKLDEQGNNVSIYAFVAAPYDAFVREGSRFWNASGIDVSLTTSGLNVRTESLQSILAGGVAFDTPVDASGSKLAAENAEFSLFASYEAVQAAHYTVRVPFRLYFSGSVDGLDVGSPVVSSGIKLGEVTDVRLEIDPQTLSVRIPVTIVLEPQRWVTKGAAAQLTPEVINQRIKRWVDGGMRASLESANLITGQKVISIAVVPDAPKASLTFEDGVPVLPTVPSKIELLTEKASAFMDKLEKAPVAELISDLRKTVQDTDRLIASVSVREATDGLRQVGPLLDSLTQTSNAARLSLEQAGTAMQAADQMLGSDSTLRYDLARLLKELTSTARSLRTLSDFLDNNPNALIFGKPAPQ